MSADRPYFMLWEVMGSHLSSDARDFSAGRRVRIQPRVMTDRRFGRTLGKRAAMKMELWKRGTGSSVMIFDPDTDSDPDPGGTETNRGWGRNRNRKGWDELWAGILE